MQTGEGRCNRVRDNGMNATEDEALNALIIAGFVEIKPRTINGGD